MSKKVPLFAAFVVVYLVWGSNYAVLKMSVQHIPPLLLAGGRCLVAGPLLLLFAWVMGYPFPRERKQWFMIGVSSFFVLVLASAAVTWAQQWVPSNIAAVVMASSSFWLVVFGAFGANGDKLEASQLASVFLGLAGLITILELTGSGFGTSLPALLMLILAAVSLALGTLVMRRYPSSCHSIVVAGLQCCFAAGLLLTLSSIFGEVGAYKWNVEALLALGYLAVFGSGVAYVLFCWLAVKAAPSEVGSIAYVNPAVAALVGYVFLGEAFSIRQSFGMIAVLVAIMLLIVRR